MIRLEHVRKVYPNAEPLKDVNAEINAGDVISVIGPSGTGKSTLLRCINLLERPDGGKIFFEDEEITSPKCNIHMIRQKMGMVFQLFNLFGNLTVIENIMLAPVRLKGESRQSAYENGMRLLRMVGLPDKYLDYPDQLSGGQKQRIAIARAKFISWVTIIMVLPERASSRITACTSPTIVGSNALVGSSSSITSGFIASARAICSRVFYLDEGSIYEEGTPDEIFTAPKREKTRRFIRRLQVVEFNIVGKVFDFPGAVSKIDTFCRKNMVGRHQSNKLHLVFEELIQQILLSSPEVNKVHAAIEHAEENGEICFDVRYDGKVMPPEELGDKLSYSLLKAKTSEIQYMPDDSEGYTNRVKILIRN